MTTLQTSHTDKFTSVVFTKALLVTFPLGCMSASRKLQTPLRWQRFCSALGYKHFLHMHMLHVFYFIPCKDEMSILVFIVTVLLLAAIKIPYSGCRCCCTGISFNKTYKVHFGSWGLPEGHCEHRHQPQTTLHAKHIVEMLNSDFLFNLVSYLGTNVGPTKLLSDSLLHKDWRRVLLPF